MLLLLFGLLAATPAGAAPLFEALGGMPGIETIVGGMLDRAVVDPRIAWAFDNTNPDRLRLRLAEYVCAVTGGPCERRARGMGAVHRHLGLRQRDFNALVENLQDSMAAAGTPFRSQLRLLAILAPMQREIVTR